MNTRTLIRRLATTPAMLVALAVVSLSAFHAQAQRDVDSISAAESSGGAALSTGLVSLAPGQAVRVSAVNVGGKEIPLQLLFVPVSDQGKAGVPIPFSAIAAPGDAATAVFQHPGGANVVQFYAQVRVDDAKIIGVLVPSVQIVDDQSGGMLHVLSGGDLVSFRPIFNPPFVIPE